MGFGEWLQLASWDVQAFFGDTDAAAHAQALRDVNSQATATDAWIYNTVESEQVSHGAFLDGLQSTLEGLWKALEAVLKYLPYILVGLVLIWGLYLISGWRKKT